MCPPRGLYTQWGDECPNATLRTRIGLENKNHSVEDENNPKCNEKDLAEALALQTYLALLF